MGKKVKTTENLELMGVPQGTLLDDDQKEPPTNQASKAELQQPDAAADMGKRRKKAEKKERKRKLAAALATVDSLFEGEAVKLSKKQKVSKELALAPTGGEGGAGGEGEGEEKEMAVAAVKGKGVRADGDDSWDKRIDGQKFGEWSPTEVNMLMERIKDWASAHNCLDDYNSNKMEFLFKRRQKQGGRGGKLPDSERKAFLEIALDFPTRNSKQIYGYISRHLDADNYKGKWSDEEKEMLTRLVEEKGAKWKDIGAAMGRAGYACRDKWRMMRNNPTSGEWSDHEVTRLKELVQEYFEAQQAGPGRGAGEGHEHLPLLDNINWKSISQILGTRNENMAGIMSVNSYQSVPHNDAFDASAHEARTTKQKWYRIAPSAISAGQWARGEDKLMLEAIQRSGVEVEHAIPWATLVPDRSLSQIKRRYKLIKHQIPNHNKLPFDALVEKLVEKYLIESADPAAVPTLGLPSPAQPAAELT